MYLAGEQWNTKDRRTGPLDRAKMPVSKFISVCGNGRHCITFYRNLHQNLITKIENLAEPGHPQLVQQYDHKIGKSTYVTDNYFYLPVFGAIPCQ